MFIVIKLLYISKYKDIKGYGEGFIKRKLMDQLILSPKSNDLPKHWSERIRIIERIEFNLLNYWIKL